MDAQPLSEATRNSLWRWSVAGLVVTILFAFFPAMIDMVGIWVNKADYSHGFLVAPFAGYLLWVRRHLLPPRIQWPDPLGLVTIILGVGLSLVGGWTNIAKEFAQGLGLILAISGAVIMMLGLRGMRWAWPGLVFLIFMVKLPDRVEIQFMFKLRQLATQSSNFVLQTLGYPSYVGGPQGTIITVGDVRLGVEWACAGLSMVLTFVAVAVAVALLVERPRADRIFIVFSAIPIAIVSNVIRITMTSLVYVAGWKWLGDVIVHDLAGYLMMPLALGFVWCELKLIDWLLVSPNQPNRDVVLKTVAEAATGNWVVKGRQSSGSAPANEATS